MVPCTAFSCEYNDVAHNMERSKTQQLKALGDNVDEWILFGKQQADGNKAMILPGE